MNTQQHHNELNEYGEGKCSVPMWSGAGFPAGFCDKPAFGNQLNPRTARAYCSGLACHAHGGPDVRYFMDGNMWCAVREGFINLQESDAGFGETKERALADLHRARKSRTA